MSIRLVGPSRHEPLKPYDPLRVTHPPRPEDLPIDGATVIAAYAVIASITAAVTMGVAFLWRLL